MNRRNLRECVVPCLTKKQFPYAIRQALSGMDNMITRFDYEAFDNHHGKYTIEYKTRPPWYGHGYDGEMRERYDLMRYNASDAAEKALEKFPHLQENPLEDSWLEMPTFKQGWGQLHIYVDTYSDYEYEDVFIQLCPGKGCSIAQTAMRHTIIRYINDICIKVQQAIQLDEDDVSSSPGHLFDDRETYLKYHEYIKKHLIYDII